MYLKRPLRITFIGTVAEQVTSAPTYIVLLLLYKKGNFLRVLTIRKMYISFYYLVFKVFYGQVNYVQKGYIYCISLNINNPF